MRFSFGLNLFLFKKAIILDKTWNFRNFCLSLPLITDIFKTDVENNLHNNCFDSNVGILLQE